MGARKKEALEQFNRDNILKAARELFETKGVEKTTMDDIASLADYSKSTIYVYFKSKEDIYNTIVSEYLDTLADQIESCLESGEDFEKSYYLLCECLVGFEEKYPQYYAGLLGETGAGGATNARRNKANSQIEAARLNGVIGRFLQKGIGAKALRPDIEISPTVMYVWSCVSGIIRVAGHMKTVNYERLKMNKEEYLRYSFRTFYDSLIRR